MSAPTAEPIAGGAGRVVAAPTQGDGEPRLEAVAGCDCTVPSSGHLPGEVEQQGWGYCARLDACIKRHPIAKSPRAPAPGDREGLREQVAALPTIDHDGVQWVNLGAVLLAVGAALSRPTEEARDSDGKPLLAGSCPNCGCLSWAWCREGVCSACTRTEGPKDVVGGGGA